MQGLVSFAGISTDHLVSAQMTLSRGTSPSVCTIDMTPLGTVYPSVGELRWRYGGTFIRFPFAKNDKFEPIGDGQGRVLWRLTVLDRRWIWRTTGSISGRYNTPQQIEDKDAQPEGVRTLRQLMVDCLQALGETDARLNLIRGSEEERPEVDWDYDRPAEALSDLCDRTGHIVVLGLDNRVYIAPKGVGNQLPTGELVIESQQTFDPPEAPAAIVVVSAPTRFQVDLELEPVGKELDGTVKPILELSYAPTVDDKPDWSELTPGYMEGGNFDPKWQGLALESVWMWYRIKPFGTAERQQAPIPLGNDITIESFDDILPLLGTQVETYEREDGKKVPRPIWIWGKFSPGGEGEFDPVERPDERLRNEPKGLYTRPFDVDLDTGIAKFDSPTFIWGNTEDGRKPIPAELKMRVAIEYRKGGYEGPRREEFHRRRRPSRRRARSAPRNWMEFVINNSLVREVYDDGETGNTVDNIREVESRSLFTWRTVASRYNTIETAASTSYAGLLPIPCDGAITQVTWSISETGETRTRASRNREESIVAPTYAERRLFERVEKELRHRK